jgi:hypothetical protein
MIGQVMPKMYNSMQSSARDEEVQTKGALVVLGQ